MAEVRFRSISNVLAATVLIAAIVPAAAIGLPPAGHPFALATLIVGISDFLGPGITGCGPVSARIGTRAEEPHAAAQTSATRTAVDRMSLS